MTATSEGQVTEETVTDPAPLVPVTPWTPPSLFAASSAVVSVGTTAAPLLAGFSFTLAALLIQSPHRTNWPDLGLVFFVSAGLAMIASMQFSLWARQYDVTPADYEMWFPGFGDRQELAQSFQAEQCDLSKKNEFWAHLTRFGYNAGVLLLLGGLTALLIPPHFDRTSMRGVAVGCAALGFLAELGWLVAVLVRRPGLR